VPWLLGAVLNALASALNVLAKAVSRVAADPDHSQEGGDEQQNNDAFNVCDHICVEIAVAYLPIDSAGGGPLFLARPQAVAVWALARLRHWAAAVTGPTVSCKLLGFSSARHAICTACIARKTHARAVDIHNALNGNLPEEENPAAQSKLNRRAWNASIRQPSWATSSVGLPSKRPPISIPRADRRYSIRLDGRLQWIAPEQFAVPSNEDVMRMLGQAFSNSVYERIEQAHEMDLSFLCTQVRYRANFSKIRNPSKYVGR
jgi:hypothetical protein